MSGTSMATPCVSGVMALMLSKNPDLAPAEICEILETTAVHLPNSSSPKGNIFGSGRINAYQAVSAVPLPTAKCDTITNLTYTLEYDKMVTLTWNRPGNDADLTGYRIYLNGVSIEKIVTEESFAFQGTVEDNYNFCVAVLCQIDGDECVSPMVCVNIPVISICDPVTHLTSNVDGYTVTLSWEVPELVSEVLQYDIYRDDEFVKSVETETFSEEVPSGLYVYAVEAKYMNECISDKVSIDVLLLEPPTNLTTVLQSEWIELFWEYEDETILFNVYRDDSKIASNIIEKQYSDSAVVVNIEYCYYVKATNEEIESATSNEVCITISGIEEYISNLKIYPNPSNSMINIEGIHIEKVTIFNTMGQIVKVISFVNDVISIDVSHFAVGNYVFCVSYSDGSIENVKVVIK
jgi:hypothetical protein